MNNDRGGPRSHQGGISREAKISFLERSPSNPIGKKPLHGHLSVFLVVGINSLFIVYLGKNQWMHLHISSNACFFRMVDDTRVCVEKKLEKALPLTPTYFIFYHFVCVWGGANTSHPDFWLFFAGCRTLSVSVYNFNGTLDKSIDVAANAWRLGLVRGSV